MFIKYQKVRNAVVGTTTAVVGGVAAFFGLRGDTPPETTAVSQSIPVEEHNQLIPPVRSPDAGKFNVVPAGNASASPQADGPSDRAPAITTNGVLEQTDQQRYRVAMEIALGPADTSGKGKDVLGPASPWKLNLYDDDRDGRWDRGKLDTNRDEVDDEKWNFKKGRWEKDGGATIWASSGWVAAATTTTEVQTEVPVSNDATQARYQSAMKIALAPADRSGKGKDVLGPSSPWKLNLYDDDKDGQWDRGKLDTNRDNVDDEKWNFKQGRWEKDGGAAIWVKSEWVVASTTPTTVKPEAPIAIDQNQARYQSAMRIALGPADRSGKGKDVLGPASPWKLNLYDDDKDGQWDRGKLDKNRDEVDDEKWNFKKGRWEKDGGATIWKGDRWKPAD